MISQLIAEKLGLNEDFILNIARSANRRYKIYSIPKRSGESRTISHPSKKLKLIQNALLQNVLNKLLVHDSVYSYKRGININDLAKLHVQNRFLLRTDFQDFFPSLTKKDIQALLEKNIKELTTEDIEFITNIVCKSGALTIGAPSSPFLSNALLYELDAHWYEFSKEKSIVYSRYADDIYFSTNIPNLLDQHYEDFRIYIKKLKNPRLKINAAKTIYTSKKRRRIVTGLILTSENTVSIGRKRKREIKSLIYQYTNNALDDKQILSLNGYLNFANMIEPSFILSLKQKYGNTVICELLKI